VKTIDKILSVGIDIGTTTTQLVFSRITLENMAGFASVPRIVIIDKEVIYRSKIYFTPLVSHNEIDYEGILSIVDAEYKAARIVKSDLSTGAVIITGETSRKDNANIVLRMLSGYAGEFVVATAGPDLEAVLAAKGAGVQTLSKDLKSTIANLDIGGGTTNIAVFRHGQLVDTTCADIGGRLIQVNKGKISYIAPKIKWLADQIGIRITEGETVNAVSLQSVTKAMTEVLRSILRCEKNNKLADYMLTVDGLKLLSPIDAITFSGGVADLIYEPDQGKSSPFAFGDIGETLGAAIRNSGFYKEYRVLKPMETIRATVIGAGIHTMELSGSTIEYTDKTLPVQNVPIIKLTLDDELMVEGSYPYIADAVAKKLNWYKIDNDYQTAALSLKGVQNPSYKQIQILCAALCEGLKEYITSGKPVIIVVEKDMAKALGQAMRIYLGNQCRVICIDSVSVENGDYIDIGTPLAHGRVVPVVIKTLALNV